MIKWRELHTSFYPLKKVQAIIHHRILSSIQLPDYAYGSVHKRNNILNALQHCRNKYFLTIDLKDYFHLIKEKQVLKMFLTNGFSSKMSTLLTCLTTYKGFLPQGPPTSPTISNLVFVKTGLKLLSLCKQNDITFTTYIDDLMFSSKHDFKDLISEILEIIKAGSFCPHPSKIHYRKNSAEITGLIARNGRVFFTKEMMAQEDSLRLESYQRGAKRIEQKFFKDCPNLC